MQGEQVVFKTALIRQIKIGVVSEIDGCCLVACCFVGDRQGIVVVEPVGDTDIEVSWKAFLAILGMVMPSNGCRGV